MTGIQLALQLLPALGFLALAAWLVYKVWTEPAKPKHGPRPELTFPGHVERGEDGWWDIYHEGSLVGRCKTHANGRIEKLDVQLGAVVHPMRGRSLL